MTPYEKAVQIKELIEAEALPLGPDFMLPDLRYAQIGAPVIPCESLVVTATNINTDGFNQGLLDVNCDAIQVTTFVIALTRDCSWMSNEDGTDDPLKVAEASAKIDKDGTFLWDWAQHYDFYLSKQFNITWLLEGGLGYTTLTLTTGVD